MNSKELKEKFFNLPYDFDNNFALYYNAIKRGEIDFLEAKELFLGLHKGGKDIFLEKEEYELTNYSDSELNTFAKEAKIKLIVDHTTKSFEIKNTKLNSHNIPKEIKLIDKAYNFVRKVLNLDHYKNI